MGHAPDHKADDLQLRQAAADDAPLLLSIMHAAFEEYRGRLDPPAGVHNETVDKVLKKLTEGHFVIAYISDEAAGCVFYRPESDYLYLGRLSVLPQYRHHGIGRILIDYVEQQAVRLSLPRVQLGVRTALTPLQAYYTRLGYQPVSYKAHEGYAEPTYVIMEKELK